MALTAYFASRFDAADRRLFMPGRTTQGHYQIELACDTCHVDAFATADAMQEACERCHAGALDEARDSHPKSKFTDPRNADRTALLDARYCVSCHVEHRPDATHAMGLTIPEDYCGICHADIADERPTHAGFAFTTCASAGCHNFHDNRALYEDFLLRHADEPDLLDVPAVEARNFASIAAHLATYPIDAHPLAPLDRDAADDAAGAGERSIAAELVLVDWVASAHASSGVNCSACHIDAAGDWTDAPGYAGCVTCHRSEQEGFVRGLHGMRLDSTLGLELEPMRPADARLPMRADPLTDTLDCGSCHAPHTFDTAYAAIEACLGCHDDTHSRAFTRSLHFSLVEQARRGEIAAERAVTCATCHLPRVEVPYDYGAYTHVLVLHNQSDNLRPSDKMIRSVCMECHGLAFSIDALADRALVDRNFAGTPAIHVESIDLAVQRRRQIDLERARATSGPANRDF